MGCGDGIDVANVDDVDVVNPDCETVNRAATSYRTGSRGRRSGRLGSATPEG